MVGALGLGLVPGTASAVPPEPPAPADITPFCTNVPAGSAFDPFVDDTGDTFEANIECLAFAGITAGGPGGRPANQYAPGLLIPRDQMASFIAREGDLANRLERRPLTDLPAFDNTNDFVDVPASNVHLANINRLAQAGIVLGGPGGRPSNQYGPQLVVTRGQMASFINRLQQFLAGGSGFSTTQDFFTDDETSVHENNINAIASRGIYVGDGVDTASPDAGTTRGQMAAFITRQLAVNVVDGNIFPAPPAAGATATTRPELTAAQVVSTTTAANVSSTNPVGTRVRFTFDEPIITFGSGVADDFLVYDSNGTRFIGQLNGTGAGQPTIESGGLSVLVNFPAVDNAANQAASLTLATVGFDTVRDQEGSGNITGDAPLGSGSSTPVGTSGTTTAPDLRMVQNFRPAASTGQSAVDFVFDEPAFAVGGAGAFHLILQDGTDIVGAAAPTGTTAAGGTGAGGNGTTTLTVIFTNQGGNVGPPAVAGTALNDANVRRGTVDTGAVSDAASGGNLNPLEAQDVASASTVEPDLVSAQLLPGSTSTAADRVIYTFDQAIATAGAGATNFRIYNAAGAETTGGTDAQINSGNTNQVSVSFGAGTLVEAAVGASVTDGAVIAASSPAPLNPLTNIVNEQDEVEVANAATTTVTPGRTTLPELTAVALSRTSNPAFPGSQGDFAATFTFDESVATTVDQTGLFLYLANGAQLQCTTATRGATDATSATVTCTAFNNVSSSSLATSDVVGSAVVGAVRFNTVTELSGGRGNPEGSELTSGGTGTPTRSRNRA